MTIERDTVVKVTMTFEQAQHVYNATCGFLELTMNELRKNNSSSDEAFIVLSDVAENIRRAREAFKESASNWLIGGDGNTLTAAEKKAIYDLWATE